MDFFAVQKICNWTCYNFVNMTSNPRGQIHTQYKIKNEQKSL